MLSLIQNQQLKNPIIFSIVYQVLAALTLTVIGFQAKLLIRVPTPQLLISRNIIQILMSILFQKLIKEKSTFYIKDKQMCLKVYIKVILGASNILLYYYAITMINLSELMVLNNTTPIWSAIIMIYVLKRQKLSQNLCVQILLCSLGIVLISKPPIFAQILQRDFNVEESSQHQIGVILIIIGALLFAITQTIIRDIGDQINTMVIVNYQSIAIIIMSSMIQIVFFCETVVLTIFEVSMIALMAALGLMTQILMTKSFQIGNVTQLFLFANSSIIFGLIFDFFIIQTHIDYLSVLGTIIIFGSLVFNALCTQT